MASSPLFALSSPMLCLHGKAAGERSLADRAPVIAASRLRGESIQPSPKLTATVADSVLVGTASSAGVAEVSGDCRRKRNLGIDRDNL
jgi:hypothetical protein